MASMTATKSRDSRSLLADDSGATMVMGIFMAMMVVGMIYYVWGLGGTIIVRERLQDAADASAFGASVFQARGMNIISMLNVLMVIFAVIGTACRLLQDFIEATAIADDAACAACLASVVCIPASETFCEPAAIHDEEWASDSWLGDIASMCDTIVEGIHGLQVVVRTGALFAGGEYAMLGSPNRYAPTVTTPGIFLPGSMSISIQSEDDSTNWACHHPLMYVRGPALALVVVGEFAFFEPISVGWIAGEIAVAAEEFGGGSDSSQHYCNNGSLTFQRVPVDHWLGDGNFQSYALVFRADRASYAWVQGAVAAANWGRIGNSAPNVLGLDVSTVTTLHGLSFADSEYYYEDTSQTSHQEWLFHTRWRARMRRFHAGSSITGSLSSVIGEVESVIVH